MDRNDMFWLRDSLTFEAKIIESLRRVYAASAPKSNGKIEEKSTNG